MGASEPMLGRIESRRLIAVVASLWWGATAALITARLADSAWADPPEEWTDLSGGRSFALWADDRRGWSIAGEAKLDPEQGKRLTPVEGEGVFFCPGGGANLVTRERYRDVELWLEFMIAERSNSGVKLNGLYEIQIIDSHAATELRGDHCGGIYPRGEALPRYHTIDAGTPPRSNAAKPAGVWQTLEIDFRSPRFDAAGEKVKNALFEHVALNGKVIHKRVEQATPTGGAWRLEKEVARGPLLLQGDHGPVAFRRVKIRPLTP